MTLPFQSQFDSTPTKTDLTEIFSVAGAASTFQSQFDSTPTKTDLTEIFSVAGAASTCLIALLSAKNVSLCCISTAIWALP